jgi:hydrophobe/amphiphile efflux-1 (HAE1) family protein
MNIARFFIDRPVFAMVLSIVTLIAGAVALFQLPVAQYPSIVPPTVIVSTNYPGANAETVANTVAAPIEQQVNGVENMLYMSSQAGNDGSYRLTVTFQVGTNLDTAQVQVQNRVAIAEPQLPEEVTRLGVTVRKASPDITLVVQLYSPTGRYDTLYMSNYALLQLRDQLLRLPGVGDVTIFGARDFAMRVWLDPQKLAARGLTTTDVLAAIREQNVQVAAGVVGAPPIPRDAATFQLTVNTLGRLVTPEQFEEIIVKSDVEGRVTRLRDVARVELGAANYDVNTYMNGMPAVGVAVFQLPGSNSIETANAVYARMAELKKTFPEGLEYVMPYDTTIFVRESIRDVIKTLIEAVILVVAVVLAFLQSWRASIIPLLAIPVSLVGTFAVMTVLGFSLNNLSLFGIVLAIGIVVDDAIVVVENVQRWLERGLPPKEAAYKAMGEVTPAVIAIAFGLSAVFIPTAFISGITGQFYRQFALTIAASTLLSAFNSLTLSPALAAILLRPHDARPDFVQRGINFLVGWFFNAFNRVLDWVTGAYAAIVRRVIQLSAVFLVLYAGLLGLTYWGFRTIPTGFIPLQDTGFLVVNLQMPDAISLYRTDAVMKRVVKAANATPGVKATFAIAGYSFISGTSQSNAGSMFVVLNDFAERTGHPEQSANAILAKLTGEYRQIQEGQVVVFPPPPVRGLSNAGGFRLQLEDRTGRASPQDLQAAAEKIITAAQGSPEVRGLFTTFRSNIPQLYVNVDRTKVKAQDIPLTSVFDTLQTFLGSNYVNDFNFLGRTYRVTAQGEARFRETAADITQLKTRNAAGAMVPLGSVIEVRESTGPARMSRYNLYTSAEINGTTPPGVSSGQAIERMQQLARDNLPPGMAFEWTELTYQQILAGNTAVLIFPLCVLLVWLTHSAEYESFSLSTAIILIVPLCLLPALFGTWVRGLDNNIFTQIGFVVLIGLSAKNAVLIVEFARQQEEHGKNYWDAVVEASRLRLRPILMTSFAFILGVFPLVHATGAGAEMRWAIGTTVFAGMIGVTFFGLIFTPVFYYVIRGLNVRFARWRGREAGVPHHQHPHLTATGSK